MFQRTWKRRLMLCLIIIGIGGICFSAFAQAPQAVSDKDLLGLVDRLEDPQKRALLINDLKLLMQTEAAAKKPVAADLKAPPPQKTKQLLFVESLFQRFEALSQRIMAAGANIFRLAVQAPRALRQVNAFLNQPGNLIKSIKLVGNILASILVALILQKILNRYLPAVTARIKDIPSGIIFGVVRIVLTLAPYVTLLAALFLSFSLFPAFATGQSLALLLFTILIFYRLTIAIFQGVLAPEQTDIRILPLSDVNANYAWVWLNRFAQYTALYFLIVNSLSILNLVPDTLNFVRGVLLLVFPLMLTVFIPQVSREMRLKLESDTIAAAESKDAPGRIRGIVVRYWSALAIAYAWVLFIFLIVHFQMGFRYLFVASSWTALTAFGLTVALRIQVWLFNKFFTVNEKIKARFPGLEDKTNRYILILGKFVRTLVILAALGIIAQIWGIPVADFIASKTGSLMILRAIAILVTTGIVLAIIESNRFISAYLLKTKKKTGKKAEATQKMKTLIPVIRTAVNIAAGFIGGIIVLGQLGVNTTPILAGAGIVGLAVGFGSQTLVKDLINGLFILFEESIRVGDYVDVGKDGGMVEAIGLRTVKLRDVSANVHIVPNSTINSVVNYSKEFSRAVIDIGVAYKEDADEVIAILMEVGEGMREDPEYGKNIVEPFEVLGLQKFDDSAIIIRCRFTTKPLKQWGLKREFNRRVKRVLDEHGIEIPFPHRTIYMGEPKAGPVPPLYVQMEGGLAAEHA